MKQSRLACHFYPKTKRSTSHLIWKGGVDKRKGSGVVCFEGKRYSANRVAWLLEYDEWPAFVLKNGCGNKRCVEVTHLIELYQTEREKRRDEQQGCEKINKNCEEEWVDCGREEK
jgi:hypothetical protein